VDISVEKVTKILSRDEVQNAIIRLSRHHNSDALLALVGKKILNECSLEIKDGETMVVIGPTGCGKTTLLRIVAGLELRYQGNVFFGETNVNQLPAKDRGVGIVFQNYALYPHMKSRENLAFYFRLRRRPEPEIDEKIAFTAKTLGVGFELLLDRKPRALSGGEQQRVALGRCIIRDPKLFLLDEPLSNLDAKLRVQTRADLKRLLKKYQVTTLYVTHDQTEAAALGDRIAVMREGRIEQVGTYEEILDFPRNLFVASFVGFPPMNFWEAKLKGNFIEAKEVTLSLPPFKVDKLSVTSEELVVGIRPADINIVPPEMKPLVSGEIELAEPLPSQRAILLHLRIGSLPLVVRADWNKFFYRGREVGINIPPEKIYLFEKTTGETLIYKG